MGSGSFAFLLLNSLKHLAQTEPPNIIFIYALSPRRSEALTLLNRTSLSFCSHASPFHKHVLTALPLAAQADLHWFSPYNLVHTICSSLQKRNLDKTVSAKHQWWEPARILPLGIFIWCQFILVHCSTAWKYYHFYYVNLTESDFSHDTYRFVLQLVLKEEVSSCGGVLCSASPLSVKRDICPLHALAEAVQQYISHTDMCIRGICINPSR